jgi:predicted transcriptional regulator
VAAREQKKLTPDNSYSLDYSTIRTEPRTVARARGRILALILVAAINGATLRELARRVSDASTESYVNYLRESGLVRLVDGGEEEDDYCYQTTRSGMKFLTIFEDLVRASPRWRGSPDTKRGKSQFRSGYYGCTNCAPHPLYPDKPPVTLHEGGICLLCHARA